MNTVFPVALLAGSPGIGEIIVIFLVVLVLFGPRRLPEIARMIGKTLHELRKASEDFKEQILAIDVEDVTVDYQDAADVSAGDDDGVAVVSEADCDDDEVSGADDSGYKLAGQTVSAGEESQESGAAGVADAGASDEVPADSAGGRESGERTL